MLRQINTVRIVLVFSGLVLVVLWVFYVNLRLRDSYTTQARQAQIRIDVDRLTAEVKTLREICESRISVLEREVFGASVPPPPKVVLRVSPDWQLNNLTEIRLRVRALEDWRMRHSVP